MIAEAQHPRDLIVANTPRVMLVLVPLFALLLMIFFWGHFYVEHLVLALHAHAYTFLIGTIAVLTRSSTFANLAMLASLVWGYVAMRRVYQQSWLKTAWKTVLITLIYSVAVGMAIIVAVLGGFFLG